PHKLHLLRNDGPAAPSVTVRFATTRDAAGAVLELVLPDGQLRRSPLLLGQGFLAEDPPERLLALPKAGARLRVVWPGQAVFDVGEVRPGELVRLRRYPQPASDILARPAPLPLGPPYTPPARICDLEKMRAELPEDDTALRPDLEASRRPLVVNVWAPWCEACMEELPGLVAAARAHPGVEVRLLAVEASPAEVRAALTGRRAGLPSARTRAGMPWRFGRALRLPTTCVYDASRRLLRMIPRPLDRGRFEDLMQTALEAAAPTPSAE
ncbi:MAG: TlpA family protein disulfide reductase, partial [Deltaproteobacteria bacterium]